MTNQEIQKKYGIEPIMKEVWVWDNLKVIEKQFVIGFDKIGDSGYLCVKPNCLVNYYINASETKPNENEPKVGDKGYFWDNEEAYAYSVLKYIFPEDTIEKYWSVFKEGFQHFSHEKQPWMK